MRIGRVHRFNTEDLFIDLIKESSAVDLSRNEFSYLRGCFKPGSDSYEEALAFFRQTLIKEGHQVLLEESEKERKSLYNIGEIATKIVCNDQEEWIEVKFFNIFPTIPDAVLNGLAIALTVGGILSAPFTGGASLLISCISVGIAIANNRKKEDDPTRLKVYKAIGEVTAKNTRDVSQNNYEKSSLSKDELMKVLGIKVQDSNEKIEYLLYRNIIDTQEKGEPDHYSPSTFSTTDTTEEELAIKQKVKEACEHKWTRLNRASWVFPSVSELVVATGLEADIVEQSLAVMIEKKIISLKKRKGKIGYWYTL